MQITKHCRRLCSTGGSMDDSSSLHSHIDTNCSFSYYCHIISAPACWVLPLLSNVLHSAGHYLRVVLLHHRLLLLPPVEGAVVGVRQSVSGAEHVRAVALAREAVQPHLPLAHVAALATLAGRRRRGRRQRRRRQQTAGLRRRRRGGIGRDSGGRGRRRRRGGQVRGGRGDRNGLAGHRANGKGEGGSSGRRGSGG